MNRGIELWASDLRVHSRSGHGGRDEEERCWRGNASPGHDASMRSSRMTLRGSNGTIAQPAAPAAAAAVGGLALPLLGAAAAIPA